MKTISGKVESSRQISLSKAARVLSNFVAAETGASNAVSAYLSRACVSFNELVKFHKELKGSKSDQKQRKPNEEIRDDGALVKHGKIPGDSEVGKKHRREKSKNREEEREGGGDLVIEDGNRKKRKNRENGGEVDLAELRSPQKKKKKRRTESDQ